MAATRFWAKSLLWISGIKVKVSGVENLPESNKIAFVSNHQSNLDIPVVISVMSKVVGFIAKKELSYFPVFNLWMWEMKCLFIDRKKAKDSILKMEKRIKLAKKGHPILLFPEGTRSKTRQMGRFKTGGIKLIIDNDLTIVPLSIIDSSDLYEKHEHIKRGTIHIHVHPPLKTNTEQTKEEIIKQLQETISSKLKFN